jgi:hydrogenase large subunit
MCFKNLPIEFDAAGNAVLKGGVADPYAYQPREIKRDKLEELLARNGHIKDVSISPVTRVAGALSFHAVADLQERKFLEANSIATLFRGYEVILKGRDPRDAIYISSRACGVCGGVHSTCAAEAIEMAFGVSPPPLGTVLRNLALALDFLYDHPLHLFLLAGPDYSQVVVEATNPAMWEKAQKTEAPNAHLHQFRTIGDIMKALNPLSGKCYLDGLKMTRTPREAYATLFGKYPHPQTVIPGGMSSTVTITDFNEAYTRIHKMIDWTKRMIPLWDDLTEFFYEYDPRYKQVGARAANLADLGIWDDPEAYDARYENCNEWGNRRWATPGIVMNGELITTNLQDIDIGFEEFVEHSYYESWTANGTPVRYQTSPTGAPLSPNHPWNKETMPKPTKESWKDRYTWDTAPRWDRQVVEAGCYARIWTTAAAKKMPKNEFVESTGTGLKMYIPKTMMAEMEIEWKIPQVWNAFERNRARAYCMAYNLLIAMQQVLIAYDYLRKGEDKVSNKFEVPQNERRGVGFWGAGRGWLAHHLVLDKGAIVNYQITTPSTIKASPKDPFGNPGPYEEAVLNTPILEDFSKPEDFTGVDMLRAIRSFDPCMPCTTHIYGGEREIVREVNTCACSAEG